MNTKQKIHDALLKELVKTDDKGKYPNLIELVKHRKFTVECGVDLKSGKRCLNIVLTSPKPLHVLEKNGGLIVEEGGTNPTAFELITDIDFDAGKKLEQVNRYKQEFADVRVIIPEKYEQEYTQLFTMNDVRVHTWKGTRRWKCKKCENITEVKDSSIKPNKCSSKPCTNTDLHFVGFKDDVQFK